MGRAVLDSLKRKPSRSSVFVSPRINSLAICVTVADMCGFRVIIVIIIGAIFAAFAIC
eukprot:m.68116 g.68116  ORF g.68116 m.68116 type:complete len:58 (-) comp19865_c1_seq1:328-501(-)